MARRDNRESDFPERCRTALESLWGQVGSTPEGEEYAAERGADIADLLRAPRGTSSTYRYVLPTQLLAKHVDPTRDARAVQRGTDAESASFDARSVASGVIVPFNRRIGSPLGTTGDPYVNNPLRVPEVSAAHRAQQKDKPRWDCLCRILEEVQTQDLPQFTERVLCQVLLELRRLLEETDVRYAPPQRISLENAIKLLHEYLEPRTGGRRLQAVVFALFRTLSESWGIYDEVLSGPVTAADAAGDRPADIDCRREGATILAVEVKDQTLTLQLLEDKITTTRLSKVQELLFLVRATPAVADDEVTERARREFVSGQSIYVLGAEPFMEHVLALIGESGRVKFVEQVGQALNELGLDYTDRRAWAELLINS